MTSKEKVLNRERQRGRAAALNLATRTINDGLDGTAIIAEQEHVPAWREDAVYTMDHVGYPVQDGDQVYTILMPHTPAHNPGFRPADLPAIYSVKHTTDPARAKPFVAPNGVSGTYKLNECCVWDGKVYRSVFDGDNVWGPVDYPMGWEEV
jgi:hypothetical protein